MRAQCQRRPHRMNSSQPADNDIEVGFPRRKVSAARDSSISRPIIVDALLFSMTLVSALMAATATASWPSPDMARWNTPMTAARRVCQRSWWRQTCRGDAPRSASSTDSLESISEARRVHASRRSPQPSTGMRTGGGALVMGTHVCRALARSHQGTRRVHTLL